MDSTQVVVGLIFTVAGICTFVGAIRDSNWLLERRRARRFVSVVGRTGARIFYAIWGVGATFGGIVLLLG